MSRDNAEQREFWSDQVGATWVAQMAVMDATFAPVLEGVLSRAALQHGERVLDIGCGAGTSSIAAGARVGTDGEVLGADISHPLLDVAAQRTADLPHVRFVCEDAQTFAFQRNHYDSMISRFGVMFFADPVAAFANIATSLRPAGRMAFATWGAIPENPWFTLPARVAKSVLGSMPKSDPDAPGPFALRDPARIEAILQGAGLCDFVVQTAHLDLTPDGDARDVADSFCAIGPVQNALSYFDASEADRAKVIEHLIQSLKPHETATGVRIPAQINFVTATKPA